MAYINHTDLATAIARLEDRDPVEGEGLHDALTILRTARDAVADDDLVEQARTMYADPSDNTIEIDDYAVGTSVADDGTWVNAWVWIPHDEEEDA